MLLSEQAADMEFAGNRKDENMGNKENMENNVVVLTDHMLEGFREHLIQEEHARATIEKYMRDVRMFLLYLGDNRQITKGKVLEYKMWLMEKYAVRSANSMLAALNRFFVYMHQDSLRVKQIKMQKNIFIREQTELSREDYRKLVKTAREHGKGQLALIMETLCSTGLRVSELCSVTVESMRSGIIRVNNKGKYRLVILPEKLRKKLLAYSAQKKIRSGSLFITAGGRTIHRTNVWKQMKKLADEAGVSAEKIFPHNLRHLFARTFYHMTGNLINLADILGHSSLEVTRIYTSESINEWKRNIESLNLLE